jgi:hypothetical protein
MGFLGFRAAGADVHGLQSCVMVCGLHRSGTSAVTRLVNLLGADIARDLAPAGPDNILGYWESSAVVAIHDRLLKAVAAVQDFSFDSTPLPADWRATNAAREAKRRLANVIQREFAGSRLFVVKDPRFWRFLPLWVELLAELGISPVVVLPFRNPLEVAASLARRDGLPLQEALLLYFCAALETERASRALPRVFVRYDHMLQDWRPFARRLGRISSGRIAQPPDGAVREIERFLTTDLYHHRFDRAQMLRQPEVPAVIVDMFDRMSEAATTGDESRLRTSFDQLRAGAEAMTRLYHGYATAELQDLRQQLASIRESYETSTSWRVTAPLRWLKLRLLSKPVSLA